MEPTSWMTKLGAIMLAISGGLGAAAQVIPKPDWKPWMECVAIFIGSVSAALMGQGIRRNIPTLRTPGRSESVTEAGEGSNDSKCQ